ncbi:MAG: hydantoinase/oxoprolinase family protein [Alphaproteobacteria bacterium]|nr:hydantoinase/oxoprolinase family protein [Alphaproteobacteria bacterium]
MAYRIGIDTGGTFTDIVAVHAKSGAVSVTKVPSTPDDPSRGLANGVAEILRHLDATPEDVIALCHGTTVATNALLEERFSALGLVVTRGFRHVLEIARQSVPEGYGNSYFWVKPDRIVPLDLVTEIDERLNYKGEVLRELDEDSARAAARFFQERGIEAVGVCLIHAYANGDHERRVRDIMLQEAPGLVISLSHEVLPEYREYERTMTTLVDAYVKPVMSRYMRQVRHRLSQIQDGGLEGRPFLVMKSNGGVISAEQVADRPIATALSGPAAGALGAAVIAELAGFRDLVSLDAGGTSTDVCLIERSQPHLTTNGSVGRFPVKLPMIDIVTVGTGGGSIAWRDASGALRVGPKSAGAVPGPMCYPNGGDEPTITDANVVLGRIPPSLIGGGLALDVDRAREGLARLAASLGGDLTVERLAAGIIEIANWSQANAIRQITVKRGIDPRSFALLSFGGSGPAQSAAVMDLLGMAACIVPPNPGNLSAFGLLSVDWITDHIRTRVMPEDSIDPVEVGAIFTELEAEADAVLARDGVPADRRHLVRHADIRYEGQASELRVDAPPGPVDAEVVAEIVRRFHAAYERAYGYHYAGEQPVEIVNLAVSGFGRIERPALAAEAPTDGGLDVARLGTRAVWFDGGPVDTPIYDRARLPGGLTVDGPAVIQEFGSTTVVFPGQRAEVDPHGILIIRKGGA